MNFRIRSILVAVVIAFSAANRASGRSGSGLRRGDSFTRISPEPGGIGLGKGGYDGKGFLNRSLSGARVGYGSLGGAAKGDGKGNSNSTGKGGYGGYTSGTLPMAPRHLRPLPLQQFEESTALHHAASSASHQAGSLRRSSSRAAIRQISEAYRVSD